MFQSLSLPQENAVRNNSWVLSAVDQEGSLTSMMNNCNYIMYHKYSLKYARSVYIVFSFRGW